MSPSDSELPAFRKLVESALLRVAADMRVNSFDELVCVLPGVYPTDARAAVERLVARGLLDSATAHRFQRRSPSGHKAESGPLLPPHPLDFDWRFDQKSADYLAERCEQAAGSSPALLIGAPTVLRRVGERGRIPATLVDASRHAGAAVAGLAAEYRFLQLDVAKDALPDLHASALVLDPPWYPDDYESFLWAAAAMGAPGAEVLVTFPAVGTRPGVERELALLLQYASTVGLIITERQERAIRYVSPPFEAAALEAAGLPDMHPEWRTGDLLTFRLSGTHQTKRPLSTSRPEWREVAVGSVRIKVRACAPSSESPRLVPIGATEVLPSVSARSSARAEADVWTTCNRVFRSANPGGLLVCLEEIAHPRSAAADDAPDLEPDQSARFAEQWDTPAVLHQLNGLVQREVSDLARYGWRCG